MTKRYKAIVVSHTHWDREWYLPFQVYRMKLVKLVDKLLGILERQSRFRNFTFDGQTIVVEDYLDIRPEREMALKKFVSEGKILVGPWYVLPDEFLVSCESIIRNLMLGHRIAESFGGVMKVGYVPDPFGHISQMPQILRGFGIDSCVFWRGLDYQGREPPTEFYWQAPDGSRVFTVHLRMTYCNAANLPEKPDEAFEMVRKLVQVLTPSASTPNVLLMNGCDHLEPQPFLPSLLEELNNKVKDVEFVQGTLSDYIDAVRDEKPHLPTLTGEQRGQRHVHHRACYLLSGTISTRIYLKQENFRTQMLLERWAEPFSAFAWTLGREYPAEFLWKSWKYLLQNHPHDSICGCSIDPVHKENLTRFQWSQQIANEVVDQSLKAISEHVNTNGNALLSLLVFNPLGWILTGIAKATIELPPDTEHFLIRDPEGRPVAFQTLGRNGKKVEVLLLAEDVPACGYKSYQVFPSTEETEISTSLRANENIIENEFLRVEVNPNGSLTVQDKRTGKTYRGINTFEDSGDAGDEYTYSPPPKDKVIDSSKEKASITLLEMGPVAATIKIDLQLPIPKGLSQNRIERSAEEITCPITSFVSLHPKIPRIDIKTVIENTGKDHRLRVIIPTGLKTKFSHAEDHFDVVKRPIRPSTPETYNEILQAAKIMGWKLPSKFGKPEGWIEDLSQTHPHQTFVDVNDGKRGITVINRGLPEYELREDSDGAVVALTLLRCVGWLSRPDLTTRRGNAGPMIPTLEAQCIGRHVFEYAIAPHAGTYKTGKAHRLAHHFNASFKVQQTGEHEGFLPKSLSFISVEPDNLILSAVKKAEKENALITRLYSIADKEIKGKIKLYKAAKRAETVDLNENPTSNSIIGNASGDSITLRVKPSKIVSVKLNF